jgi:hypothetical protein
MAGTREKSERADVGQGRATDGGERRPAHHLTSRASPPFAPSASRRAAGGRTSIRGLQSHQGEPTERPPAAGMRHSRASARSALGSPPHPQPKCQRQVAPARGARSRRARPRESAPRCRPEHPPSSSRDGNGPAGPSEPPSAPPGASPCAAPPTTKAQPGDGRCIDAARASGPSAEELAMDVGGPAAAVVSRSLAGPPCATSEGGAGTASGAAGGPGGVGGVVAAAADGTASTAAWPDPALGSTESAAMRASAESASSHVSAWMILRLVSVPCSSRARLPPTVPAASRTRTTNVVAASPGEAARTRSVRSRTSR